MKILQKGIGLFNSHAPQKTTIVIMSQNKRILLIFPSIKNIWTESPGHEMNQSRPSVRSSVLTISWLLKSIEKVIDLYDEKITTLNQFESLQTNLTMWLSDTCF